MNRVLIIGSDNHKVTSIGDALSSAGHPFEYTAGHCDALQRLRSRSFAVVINSPDSAVEEDLALLEEMRLIRPGVNCIVLAHRNTPDEVIAALRANIFACFTAPFNWSQIALLARQAASESPWREDIHVLSARPGWVSVRINCRLITADRIMAFAKELNTQLPEGSRMELMQALREILLNAMEHGGAYDPEKVVELTAVRTARALVFYLRDPGTGFRPESLAHAAIANPPENPAAHIRVREKQGMRPGGYGLLMAAGTVDELIYSDVGNQVLLIKYMDSISTAGTA